MLRLVSTSVVADCHVTSMTVGKPFKTTHESVVIGTSDGQVLYYRPKLARKQKHATHTVSSRRYQDTDDTSMMSSRDGEGDENEDVTHQQNITKVEIKGGCLSHILTHDLFEFGEVNIVTGDTDGVLSVLSDNRIFRQKCLAENSSVVAICVDTNTYVVSGDDDGSSVDNSKSYASPNKTHENKFNAIVAADSTGTITGLGSMFDVLWRIKLSHHVTYRNGLNSGIRFMTSLTMLDAHTVRTHVLVVADGEEVSFKRLSMKRGYVVHKFH